MELIPKLPLEEWGAWIYRAICLAVFLTACYLCWNYGVLETQTKADTAMAAHVRTDADALAARNAQIAEDQQAATAQYQSEAEAHARETFRRTELQAAAERKKDEALADITRRADALARELRSRPERPAGDAEARTASAGSTDPTPRASCTGAGLYRGDAAFLVRFAADAARNAAERDACFDKYEAVTPQ